MPQLIVADAGYTPMAHMVVPFVVPQAGDIDIQHRRFNTWLARARVINEQVIGICKNRWRLLMGRLHMEVVNARDAIITGFTLHNFLGRLKHVNDI